MSDLHIPEYSPHQCVPTRDAYNAVCSALEEHKKRLAEVSEILTGIAENGPWVLITDPALNALVGRHVADACVEAANAGGLDEAARQCGVWRGSGDLPLSLPKAAQ